MQSRTSSSHAIENSRQSCSRELQTVTQCSRELQTGMQSRTPESHTVGNSRQSCSRELQTTIQSRIPDNHIVRNAIKIEGRNQECGPYLLQCFWKESTRLGEQFQEGSVPRGAATRSHCATYYDLLIGRMRPIPPKPELFY